MRPSRIAEGFERLAPWVTRFEIDRQPYGGGYDAAHDGAERIADFHQAFPGASAILDLGCLEGGHTLALARLAGVNRVVGVEGRDRNVERAEFALKAAGAKHARVLQADLETFDLGSLGRFDAVLNCGLLYHLPEPWDLLDRIAAITDGMYLSTHYHVSAECTEHGYEGGWHGEFGVEDPLSGLSAKSFWPTRDDLIRMVQASGLSETRVTFDEPGFQHGPLICIVARRPAPE